MNDHNDTGKKAPDRETGFSRGASWREKLGLRPGGGAGAGSPRDLLAGKVRPGAGTPGATGAARDRGTGEPAAGRSASGTLPAGAAGKETPADTRPVVRPAPLAPRKPVVRPNPPAGSPPSGKGKSTTGSPLPPSPPQRRAVGAGRTGTAAGIGEDKVAGPRIPPPPPPPPPPKLRRLSAGLSGKPAAGERQDGPSLPAGGARTVRDDDFARRLRAQREAAERLAAQRMTRLKGGASGAATEPGEAVSERQTPPAAMPAEMPATERPAGPPAGPASGTADEGPAPRAPGGRKKLPFTFADTDDFATGASPSSGKASPAEGAAHMPPSAATETAATGRTATADSVTAGQPPESLAGAEAPPHAGPPSDGAWPARDDAPVSRDHAQASAEELFEDVDSLVPSDGRARPQDYVSALEALETGEPERRSRVIWIFLLALLLVVAVAMAAVYFYRTFSGGPQAGKVPVIVPQQMPVKVKPQPPAQQVPDRQVPVRRKKIYDRILGNDADQGPARLKPSEEKPLTPPAAPVPGDSSPAEPLPLPLPPPPALNGGQGGDAAPTNGIGDARTAALSAPPSPSPPALGSTVQGGRAAGHGSKERDKAADDVAATPVSGGSEADRKPTTDSGKAPVAATDLPLPPPPPPVGGIGGGESSGNDGNDRAPAASDGEALDTEGMTRLAAQAAGRAEAGGNAGISAGESGRAEASAATEEDMPLQQPMPATAVRRLKPEARKAAATAGKGAVAGQKAKARGAGAEGRRRSVRQARAQARREQQDRRIRKRTAKALPRRPTRPAARGPRSILPQAVAGGDTAMMERPAGAMTATGPRPIVPPSALQSATTPRRVTNFETGSRRQAAAPRRITNLATGRRAGQFMPARPAPVRSAPAAAGAREQRLAALAPRTPGTPAADRTPQAGQGHGGFLVQLAAYRSREDALRAYQRLQARHGALLGGMSPRIERKDLGAAGTFYRLAVGPLPSRTAARKLCNALIARGERDCLVRRQ